MIIVIEGMDGSGKNTVAEAVSEQLGITTTSFPQRTTETGRQIHYMLQNGIKDPIVFQALQTVNRLEKYQSLQIASRSLKYHLILVRYWQSAWVYGQIDGLDPEWIYRTNAILPKGDLNILLDIDPEEAIRRRIKRGEASEHYERQNRDLQVSDTYRALWAPKNVARSLAGGRWIRLDVSGKSKAENIGRVVEVIRLGWLLSEEIKA
jgi:dTMP kinase